MNGDEIYITFESGDMIVDLSKLMDKKSYFEKVKICKNGSIVSDFSSEYLSDILKMYRFSNVIVMLQLCES